MSLVLTLDMPTEISLGGDIRVQIALQNVSMSAIETASLFDNSSVFSLELYSESGSYLGRYNHLSCLHLHENSDPRVGDYKLITLHSEQSEQRSQNFCTWFSLTEPGNYSLRALYVWDSSELRSPHQYFQVVPASIASVDYQWTYHYGEKFMLNAVWIAEVAKGQSMAYFRKSARFSPHIVETNFRAYENASDSQPRVSFDVSLMATGAVWLAWMDGSDVLCAPIDDEGFAFEPVRVDSGLQDLRWAAAPIVSGGDLYCILQGRAGDGARMLVCLKVDASGIVKGRQYVAHDFSSAEQICGVSDRQGGYRLIWREDVYLYSWAFDLQTMQAIGQPLLIWSSPKPVCGIFLPPVLSEERRLCCMNFDQEALTLTTVWLDLNDEVQDRLLKSSVLEFPHADSIVSCEGTLSGKDYPYVLIRSEGGVHYINPMLGQFMTLADRKSKDLTSLESLIVTPRNDVYCSANRQDVGLSEWRLHSGYNEDLSDV